MALRHIVKIDEELCDGCGLCVPACAEGAIQIVDGKAKLVRDEYCDGLGECLGDCPNDAISIEEREAEAYDEEAVKAHLAAQKPEEDEPPEPPRKPVFRRLDGGPAHGPFGGGCPSARIQELGPSAPAPFQAASPSNAPSGSALGHWPVKLKLVPPGAPFLRGADLMLAADCVPFAYADLHRDLLPDHAVVIGCPKFDDYLEARARLTEILRSSGVRSLTVVTMEVPCCFGYRKMAQEAVAAAGGGVPLKHIVIGVRGELREVSESQPRAAAM